MAGSCVLRYTSWKTLNTLIPLTVLMALMSPIGSYFGVVGERAKCNHQAQGLDGYIGSIQEDGSNVFADWVKTNNTPKFLCSSSFHSENEALNARCLNPDHLLRSRSPVATSVDSPALVTNLRRCNLHIDMFLPPKADCHYESLRREAKSLVYMLSAAARPKTTPSVAG